MNGQTTETRTLLWSVRREIWENRFLYLGPAIVAAVVMFGTFISIVTGPYRTRAALGMAPAPIMFSTIVIGIFYSLDALYGERRDRSILFWKSLPLSDRVTVLSKAAVPLLVLPAVGYVLSVFAQLVLGALSTPVLLVNRINPASMWNELRFYEGLLIMFYGLAVHALWFAPIYAWFILISAWARRAPFLWAALPPLAIAFFERIVFNSAWFVKLLQYRVTGAMREAFDFQAGRTGHVDRLRQLTPGDLLLAPGFWLGLLFAAACLAAAIRMRRNREPI